MSSLIRKACQVGKYAVSRSILLWHVNHCKEERHIALTLFYFFTYSREINLKIKICQSSWAIKSVVEHLYTICLIQSIVIVSLSKKCLISTDEDTKFSLFSKIFWNVYRVKPLFTGQQEHLRWVNIVRIWHMGGWDGQALTLSSLWYI